MKNIAMSALLSVLFLSVGCAHNKSGSCGERTTASCCGKEGQCNLKSKDKKDCCCKDGQCDMHKKDQKPAT